MGGVENASFLFVLHLAFQLPQGGSVKSGSTAQASLPNASSLKPLEQNPLRPAPPTVNEIRSRLTATRSSSEQPASGAASPRSGVAQVQSSTFTSQTL